MRPGVEQAFCYRSFEKPECLSAFRAEPVLFVASVAADYFPVGATLVVLVMGRVDFGMAVDTVTGHESSLFMLVGKTVERKKYF